MNAPLRPLAPGAGVARTVEARLRFAVAGGRTALVRQHVPYPFHVTRPFWLDPARPDLATLYLQSASGGMYRDDDLSLSLQAGADAAVHVTTQASTIVHDGHGRPSRQAVLIEVGQGAALVYTPDPMILMPGADFESRTRVEVAAGSVAVVAEGVFGHDPEARGRPFASARLSTEVLTSEGRLLVRDRGEVTGEAFAGAASPLGTFRAYGSLLVISRREAAVALPPSLLAELREIGVFAALSPLPNKAGQGLRLLAPDGGSLSAGLDLAARRALASVFGTEPAKRRK